MTARWIRDLTNASRSHPGYRLALRSLSGAASGLIATGPMTAMMLAFHRRLPWWERYALPPEEITTQLAQRAGARQLIRGKPRAAATWVAHFGYGAAAGAVYAPLAWLAPGRPVLKGMLFGLLVWAGSYLGWLPAADILPPATQHPARRNALMIGAHLIWGAVTGLAADRARRLIEEQASA